MGKICKHRELALEEFHRKNFLLEALALLHPEEAQGSSCFQFLMMCEFFTLGH